LWGPLAIGNRGSWSQVDGVHPLVLWQLSQEVGKFEAR
jgi:hypothetical protein